MNLQPPPRPAPQPCAGSEHLDWRGGGKDSGAPSPGAAPGAQGYLHPNFERGAYGWGSMCQIGFSGSVHVPLSSESLGWGSLWADTAGWAPRCVHPTLTNNRLRSSRASSWVGEGERVPSSHPAQIRGASHPQPGRRACPHPPSFHTYIQTALLC